MPESLSEEISAECCHMGSCGVQIETHGPHAILLAYFEAGEERDVPAAAVESLLDRYGLTNTGMAVSDVPREDWEADWRQFFSPIWPTPNIVVHPSWIPVEIDSSQIAIVIDPKMAKFQKRYRKLLKPAKATDKKQ